MNDSKTYTISEDLYKAIIENAYIKGVRNGHDRGAFGGEKEVIKNALDIIRKQQYIYND